MRALLKTAPVLIAAFASPAFAADEHGGGGALPQFRQEYFAGQLFWLALAFGLLYLLLKNIALPRVESVQHARDAHRGNDLTMAAAANDAAKGLIADYEKSLATARNGAQQRIAAMTDSVQKQAAAETTRQRHALDAKLAAIETAIAAKRAAAMKEVHGAAAAIMPEILARLTGGRPDALGAHIEPALKKFQARA